VCWRNLADVRAPASEAHDTLTIADLTTSIARVRIALPGAPCRSCPGRRTGEALGGVLVARARREGTQRRGWRLVEAPRRVRQVMSEMARFPIQAGHESARYRHVPNCAWTATLASWEGADGEIQA